MSTPKRLHIGMSLAPPGSAAMPGGAPTATSKASSAAISPSTSPGARSRPPRLRVSPGRQQPATGRAGDRLRLRQPGSHRTACRGRPRNLADRPGVDGLHHVLSALRGGPAAAIAALDQQRPRRLEHRHRAAGPRELRPERDARCGAALRARRRVHPAGARPVGQLPREALLVDRESGRYADVSRVRPVDHDGEFLKVKGPLNLPAFGEARIPLVQAGASEAGAISPPRWPTWCSRRPRTRRLPWNCAATFPAAPNATVARRATCACCRASACTWQRAARRRGKSSCRPTRAWTARASSPRSGRCSASTSATGRWTGRFPRPTCRRRWPTPAAAPTPTCCVA